MFIRREKGKRRLYKCIVVLITLFCLLFTLSACGGGNSSRNSNNTSTSTNTNSDINNASNQNSAASSNTNENANNWLEYENEEYDFVFMYPSSWELREAREAKTYTVSTAPKGGGALFSITSAVGEDPFLLDYTDLEVVNEILAEYLSSFSYKNLAIERDWDEYWEVLSISADLSTPNEQFELLCELTNQDGFFTSTLRIFNENYKRTIALIWDSYDYYYDYDDADNYIDEDFDIADYLEVTELFVSDSSLPGYLDVSFILTNSFGEDLFSLIGFARVYDVRNIQLGETVLMGFPTTYFTDGSSVKITCDFKLTDEVDYFQLFIYDGVDEYTSDQWIYELV